MMNRQRHSARFRNRRAFALLATLGISIAISAIGLAFSLESRRNRLAAINTVEVAQADAAAEAGIETSISRLDQLNNGTLPNNYFPYNKQDPWQWCDTLLSERYSRNGLRYDVRVRDVGALFDVDGASENDWRLFLTGFNIDDGTASRLAQTVSDWIDPDDNPRGNGAEKADYIRAGYMVLPPNRPMRSIEELRDVMGMTPNIYNTIAPYIDAGFSNGAGISVNTAPPPLLRAIPGFSDDVISTIMSIRSSHGRITSMAQLAQLTRQPALVQQPNANVRFSTRSVLIESTGWSPGGMTHVTHYAVVQWQSPPNPTTIVMRRTE